MHEHNIANAVATEFATAELGDLRLTKRATRIVQSWARSPSVSFPKMFEDDAELQALYGFFSNEGLDPDDLLAAHREQTLERIRAGKHHVVRVLHDTTSFSFDRDHDCGIGWLGRNQQGFFGHFALAVTADDTRCPFGVIALATTFRERPSGTGPSKKQTRNGKRTANVATSESRRWATTATAASDALRGCAIPIHIMDREADSFFTLGSLVAKNERFVVRVREPERPLDGDDHARLGAAACDAAPLVCRSVSISVRRKSSLPALNKSHPPRAARTARLEIAGTTVTIRKPKHLVDLPDAITVNVVHARELDVPDGVEPIDWLLYTTERVATADDVLAVVDHYRARWQIEEFFKALKTGCGYEKRQLESRHGLLIALSLCIPIAAQMLLLRHVSREQPNAPAETVLSPDQLEALRTIVRKPLSAKPTAHEVLLAIARLGGHLKGNGPPGWQTIHGGLEKVVFATSVIAAARAQKDL